MWCLRSSRSSSCCEVVVLALGKELQRCSLTAIEGAVRDQTGTYLVVRQWIATSSVRVIPIQVVRRCSSLPGWYFTFCHSPIPTQWYWRLLRRDREVFETNMVSQSYALHCRSVWAYAESLLEVVCYFR